MKKNSAKDYAQAIYAATHGITGANLHGVLNNFVELLARERKLKQADQIIAEFVRYAKKQEGIAEIEITSARKLAGEVIHEISKAFGKKVETAEKVDVGILGGVIVKSADKIFDGSLKTQLVRLKESLV